MAFKPSKDQYADSAEFTEDLIELKELAERLQTLVRQPALTKWLQQTDQNFDTDCAPYLIFLKQDSNALTNSVQGLMQQIDKADQ